MIVNYQFIQRQLIGSRIPKPMSGTLSGHAAGEPFDKSVYEILKKQLPKNTFRQYEYLNDLFSKNPQVIGVKARKNLFKSPIIMFLLSRGNNATDKWNEDNLFSEKQNDTADILVVKDNFYELLDVKTRNIDKNAQPPNIISGYKLAQVCAKMIDNLEFDIFTINYLEIDWKLESEFLICKDVHLANLFRAHPQTLYINWSAAMQIQFHVADLNQDCSLDRLSWAKKYIEHFVTSAKVRADQMIDKFVKPFQKYLD